MSDSEPAVPAKNPKWSDNIVSKLSGITAIFVAGSALTVAAANLNDTARQFLGFPFGQGSSSQTQKIIPDFVDFSAQCGSFLWTDPKEPRRGQQTFSIFSCDDKLCNIAVAQASKNPGTKPDASTETASVYRTQFQIRNLGDVSLYQANGMIWPTILQISCKVGNCYKSNESLVSTGVIEFSTDRCADEFKEYLNYYGKDT